MDYGIATGRVNEAMMFHIDAIVVEKFRSDGTISARMQSSFIDRFILKFMDSLEGTATPFHTLRNLLNEQNLSQ